MSKIKETEIYTYNEKYEHTDKDKYRYTYDEQHKHQYNDTEQYEYQEEEEDTHQDNDKYQEQYRWSKATGMQLHRRIDPVVYGRTARKQRGTVRNTPGKRDM